MLNRFLAAGLAALSIAPIAEAGVILNDTQLGKISQIEFFEPMAQDFIAIDTSLLTIAVRFADINAGFPSYPNDPIRVDLYSGFGTGGLLLGAKQLLLPLSPSQFDWVDFDFGGVPTNIGGTYTFAVSVVGSSPLTGIVVDDDDGYADGMLSSPRFPFRCTTFCDLAFRITGTTGTGPDVPEPATWAMMIAGFGLVGATARRRRAMVS